MSKFYGQPEEPMEFYEKQPFVPVDEWVPLPEDEIFKTNRGVIMLDVSSFFGMENNANLDAFVMSTKRSYNNPDMRAHTVQYLNYFEKFYDQDHELLMIYYRLKYLIDFEPAYSREAFFYDLERYIMRGSIALKVGFMNRDNYNLKLTYRNAKNPNLQYSDCLSVTLIWKHSRLNSLNCWEGLRLICHRRRRKDIVRLLRRRKSERSDKMLYVERLSSINNNQSAAKRLVP